MPYLLALQCTGHMEANPLVQAPIIPLPWEALPWVATTGIGSGQLQCGDAVCLENPRTGATVRAYVVDQGGKGGPVGFDLDYNRVFKVLDPDNQDYRRGSMDIKWRLC